MPDQSQKLVIEIKNVRPIEIIDFTNSLLAVGEEYKRFISKNSSEFTSDNFRLYINEIRPGSVVAELIALAPAVLPLMENVNTIYDFIKNLKDICDYLLGSSQTKPEADKITYENMCKILEPVAKDSGAQLNIGILNTTAPIYISSSSIEANALQNAARREIQQLKDPSSSIHEKVVLYWYQARNDPKSQVGDKAIIESIDTRPIRSIFVDEKTKERLIKNTTNPFTKAFIVDVSVETIKERPVLYRIMHIHEEIELDETS